MRRRLLWLWAIGCAPMVPLFGLQGAGMALVSAAAGGAVLYANAQAPDGGMRKAAATTAVVAGLVLFGLLRR